MITVRTPQQVREGANFKKFEKANDRIAVIVTIPFSKRKQDLGIQFWTEEMIREVSSKNADGTISKFVELY